MVRSFGEGTFGSGRFGGQDLVPSAPRRTRWSFAVGAWTDGPRDLVELRDARLTVNRTSSATLEGSIDGRAPIAGRFVDLVSDAHAWRDDVKVFRGRLGPNGDDIDGARHALALSFGDYRAVLQGRILYDNDLLTAGPITGDVGDVVAALVELTQSRPYGDLGITLGAGFPAGRKVRDLELSPGTTIAAAIDTIANTAYPVTGFEWEITGDLVLNLYHRGRRTPVTTVLKYGDNVTKVKRTVEAGTYANVIRGNGSSDSGIARTVSVDDLATRPEGRWEAQVGFSNVNGYSTLAAAVSGEHDRRGVIRPAYTLTLRPGWWQGPGHLWVGHTTRVHIRSGRVDVDEDLIVERMTITPTANGIELVTVDVDAPSSGLLRRVVGLDQRVSYLERN